MRSCVTSTRKPTPSASNWRCTCPGAWRRELRCPVDTSATTSPSSSTETMPRMSPAVSGRLSRAGQSLSASPQSLLLRRRHHGRAWLLAHPLIRCVRVDSCRHQGAISRGVASLV